MKPDLLKVTLNEADEPVIEFTHTDSDRSLEQKLLGALIRKMARQGPELSLQRTYGDDAGKTHWDYQIRAKPINNETEQRPTQRT